jgi:membrane-associated phospholipid phosphatase
MNRLETIRCIAVISLFLCLSLCPLFGQDNETRHDSDMEGAVPLSLVFHDIGWNTLHSFSHNYGANWIASGIGTWAFIETGIDWKWRNIAYNNDWLSSAGIPFTYVGWVVPFATPVILNLAGRIKKDNDLQIAGLALAQAALLTAVLPTPIKASLGRSKPGIITKSNNYHVKNPRQDDFSGEFDWFNLNFIDGWPSGHTAQAFAAAAVLTELYEDSLALKIVAYSYAVCMGLAVSVTTHWASESVAGALIGLAIGKTVGLSFSRLSSGTETVSPLGFYATPDSLGVILRF